MTDRPQRSVRNRVAAPMPPGFPPIVRPAGLARPPTPGSVPDPQHHHLPAWVRRAHGQARPIVADLLGTLTGERRDTLASAVDSIVAAINAGKFSQAFRYADVIAEGGRLLAAQRTDDAEAARVQRALDAARRRAGAELRDAAPVLSQEVSSRLSRSLRAAPDVAAIDAVAAELAQAVDAARSHDERRREREIHRTRTHIARTSPRAPASDGGAQDWQEVLRRLQEEMTAGTTG